MAGVQRIDHKRTHGWQGRVYWGGQPPVTKMFSDRKHGGQRKARIACAIWVAQKKRELGPRPTQAYLKAPLPFKTTPLPVGVHRYEGWKWDTRRECYYWTEIYFAGIRVRGVHRRRCFSITLYGEAGAREMAIEARKRMVKDATSDRDSRGAQW